MKIFFLVLCLGFSITAVWAGNPDKTSGNQKKNQVGKNLLPNGDFEEGFQSDGIAKRWKDDSAWASLKVGYSKDKRSPAGGACQHIACTSYHSGAVQFVPDAGVAIKKGKTYRVSALLRGDPIRVTVQLRQKGPPYRVYVAKEVLLAEDWQKTEFLWTATVDDPGANFMIRFADIANVFVDDLSVEEMDPAEAARRAVKPAAGNLLLNGDFALGLTEWFVNRGNDSVREARLRIELEGENPCLRIDADEGISAVLSSEAVALAPGNPVVLSLRLRADREIPVKIGSEYAEKTITAGEEWQDIRIQTTSFSGFAPVMHDYLRLSFKGVGTLWIDDVELRQDGRQDLVARPRAAISTKRHPQALYHDGEPLELDLQSFVPKDAPETVFDWRIENFWDEKIASGNSKPGAGLVREKISINPPHGWYRAVVEWQDGNKPCSRETTFCVLPPAERKGPARTSPFGAHFSAAHSGLALAKAVGVRWLRLHPPNLTKWRLLEPEKGRWQWQDESIRQIKEAGFEILGSLDRVPIWASSAPPGTPPDKSFYTGTGAFLPKNWDDWENYVAKVVSHYRGIIDAWEIWNEGNLADWLKPPPNQTRAEAYVELLKHTTPIVRRENPEATVVGLCTAGPLMEGSTAKKFADEVISLGGLDLMDEVSFHHYIARPIDEGDEPLQVWLANLREHMREAGRELPVINSEGGFSNPGSAIRHRSSEPGRLSIRVMAPLLVRQYVSQIAEGVRQFYFYNFFINGSPLTRVWEGFVEGDGQPRPNVAAYAVMTWLLDGATFEKTERPKDGVWVHNFTTPRGRLAVAWTASGAKFDMPSEGIEQGWDLMGAPLAVSDTVTLTDSPIYLLRNK